MRFQLFTFIYPKKLRENLVQLLFYSDIRADPRNFLGFGVFFELLLSLFITFALGDVIQQPLWIVFIVSFIVMQIISYFWLVVSSDKKAKFIEDVLPDALLLMASNLRAGHTTDRAFFLAARPEFGPLQDEILRLGKEVTAGKEIGPALQDIRNRVKSQKLARAIQLISSGIRSGGKLADLLQETAIDFKNQKLVDRKIRANVNMYVIFIFVAISFGAPLLFGLSSYLVEVLIDTFAKVDIPSQTSTATFSLPINFQTVNLDPEIVIIFSVLNLGFSSIFGAFIIGLISKGKEKEGIKYIPILMALSIGFFFLIRYVARAALSGLFAT